MGARAAAKHGALKRTAATFALGAAFGCAADPGAINKTPASEVLLTEAVATAQAARGARISFYFSDYFSLTSPNPVSACAGDARTYYDPIAWNPGTGSSEAIPGYALTNLTGSVGAPGPLAYPKDIYATEQTIRPAFIKNISVDLTDAGASVSANAAYACSMGNAPGVPPVAQCASFDYGALGGIPTTLGGSMLLVGGLQGNNYSGFIPSTLPSYYVFQGPSLGCGPANATYSTLVGSNSCRKDMVALGVDSLPASVYYSDLSLIPGFNGANAPTAPISNWSNLSSGASYTGPKGATGGALTYDPDLGRALLFGGASPVSVTEPTGNGVTTYDTWIYNLKTQKWDVSSGTPLVSSTINSHGDTMLSITSKALQPTYNAAYTASAVQISKNFSGRMLFGYVPVPGVALNENYWSAAGTVVPATDRDLTDRLLVTGGTNDGLTSFGGTHRFNPTFGPEMMFANNASGATPIHLGTTVALPIPNPLQWIDSHVSQLMSNSLGVSFAGASAVGNHYNSFTSLLRPDMDPPGAGSVGGDYVINNAVTPLFDAATFAGYLLSLGGTSPGLGKATPSASLCNNATPATAGLLCNGHPMLLSRYARTAASETVASDYLSIPNYRGGWELSPSQWFQLDENANAAAATVDAVPWMNGAVALPGTDRTLNDVVYFGGSDCLDYISGGCTTTTTQLNPGKYWQFGASPRALTAVPATAIAVAGTYPQAAGMAAARGLDAANNVIIVAWGGIKAALTSGTPIYYLYSTGAATRAWVAPVVTGTIPTGLTNAQMVFSHVTKKFYLYGGLDTGSGVTRGETWELTAAGTAPAITFTWKQLTPTAYPATGPGVRRSHRMAEVNYNNVTPSATPVCTAAATPCSFGIFMEGGTNDGTHFLADRWMFDPTANGGTGHWQQVGEMPPRTLGAIASSDFYVPAKAKKAHRAILFGGETGLQAPGLAATDPGGVARYFVPPTLGDTWMYDYDNNTWNRVELLGKGYAAAANLSTLSEAEKRQAYSATTATRNQLSYLTPPPLSGAIMVTRTFAKTAAGAVSTLKIPEVFLFGGRKKDGTFHTLDNVYKFCTGSTGERYSFDAFAGGSATAVTDFTCDAYDATANSASTSPTDLYVGRWLKKLPVIAPAPGAYLGAGAYDSNRDRILIFGGFSAVAGTAVTAVSGAAVSNAVYEYAPPQFGSGVAATDLNGAWRTLATCTGYTAPPARYGHSMAYDPLTQSLVVMGGIASTHLPATQTVTYSDGRSYVMPEIWAGKFVPGATPATDCLAWTQKTTFGNSFDNSATAPPTGGLAFAASAFIPSQGYNSGFYSLFDNACANQGPIGAPDPNVNKLLAGGVYIDLDRTQMGANENAVLNLTYLPMSPANVRPDHQNYTQDETALFKVHLVRTGQSTYSLQAMIQPRHLSYSAADVYPQIAQSISVLPRTEGQMVQEQIFLPLASDPAIDRIRIERYSGSGLLIDASLYRLGGGK